VDKTTVIIRTVASPAKGGLAEDQQPTSGKKRKRKKKGGNGWSAKNDQSAPRKEGAGRPQPVYLPQNMPLKMTDQIIRARKSSRGR
jgi:hypothetical protein